jgi:hypothetical protein
VRSRFDTLMRDGLISFAEYDARDAWSRDYHAAAERSVRLVGNFELGVTRSGRA